jgi:hypothetical protein
MKTLHATVRNGRLVMDEPTELPEGAVVELIPSDGDGLDEEERRALHADLDGSWAQAEAGKMQPAEEVIRELRARYGGRTNDPER